MNPVKAAVAGSVLFLCSPAHSQVTATPFSSGNDFLAHYGREAKYECSAYVIGAADVLQLVEEQRFCPGTGITEGQLKDIVLDYIRSHSSIRHYRAGVLTALALENAFPYQRARK